MNIKASDTMGGIVTQNFQAAEILACYGLDFCCGGTQTLADACSRSKAPLGKVLQELAALQNKPDGNLPDFAEMKLDALADYIEKVHHHYTSEKILFIKPNLGRLVVVHGARHPELGAIKEVFEELAAHLTIHMKHEEFMLFPYIRKMTLTGKKVKSKVFRSIESPVASMMNDHETEGKRLERLAQLTHHYTIPPDGCATYRATFGAMKELKEDLHRHIHLENNILFPKALAQEKRFDTEYHEQRVG